MAGCDKNFEEINTNPQQVSNVDPGFLFTNALRNTPLAIGWPNLPLLNNLFLPYNLGTTLGYQFNENVDGLNAGPFNAYTGSLKHIVHVISLTKDDPARSNLYNMARIWKAYNAMWLVDHYGDVPYFETGLAYLEGSFSPKYDKDDVIYEDLYKELKEATAALNANGDNNVRFDIFIPSSYSTENEVTYWKRLGYSIILAVRHAVF